MTKHTNDNKQKRVDALEAFTFNGDAVAELMEGAVVIWHDFDGWDWHVLIRRTKERAAATGWEYLRMVTMFDCDSMRLFTMTTHNNTKAAVIKKAIAAYWEDRGHKNRMADRYATEDLT